MELTQRELLILNSHKLMLQSLAQYLGPGYEVVLHSFGTQDSILVDNINGYCMGQPKYYHLTDIEKEMLDKIKSSPANQNGIVYFHKTYVGKSLRSTAIPIRGEVNRIIGLLSISFHMDVSLSSVIEHMTNGTISVLPGRTCTTYANSIEDIVSAALLDAREELRSQTKSPINRNKAIIESLEKKSIFTLKNSVEVVAKQMGLSKNTVYAYLKK